MSTFEVSNATNTELANGSGQNSTTRRYRRRRRRRRWQRESSDSESDSDQSWHSPLGSMGDGICEPQSKEKERGSFEEIDLESGELESRKEERDCRICHMSLSKSCGIGSSSDRVVQQQEESTAIELGCSCKGDLAAAHKQCAETWFKTKGNTICEICGATALNVAGEQMNEANTATTVPTVAAPAVLSENQAFWHGRRVMNFLLASMVFAFVISWLFHFNILP